MARPEGDPIVAAGASTPPAPGPEGEILYQQLYAGEFGDASGVVGQRARVLAWLRYVGFTAAHLEAVAGLTADILRSEAADAQYIAEVDAREWDTMVPVYAQLVALYAAPEPVTDDALAPLSLELADARKQAYGSGEDPRDRHYTHVRIALSRTGRFLGALPTEQLVKVAAGRFFLQRRLGPFVSPGDYSKWLGTAWNGSDYASLRTGIRAEDEGMMDIGGLWSYEPLASDDAAEITGLRAAVIMLYAIESPGFAETVAVARGQRTSDDYTELLR